MITSSALNPNRFDLTSVDSDSYGVWSTHNIVVPQHVQAARVAHASQLGIVQRDGEDVDLGASYLGYLKRGCVDDVVQDLDESRDAAVTQVVAHNADLFSLRYPYLSHKGMDLWLEKAPRDGVLKMNLVITPSWHVGATEADMQKNGEAYGKSNTYNLEILYPDGKRELIRFDTQGRSPPKGASSTSHNATQSPTFTIDVKRYAGQEVVIRGWADHSSPEGYIEARQSTLHIPA